jgi:hypothetical protein
VAAPQQQELAEAFSMKSIFGILIGIALNLWIALGFDDNNINPFNF